MVEVQDPGNSSGALAGLLESDGGTNIKEENVGARGFEPCPFQNKCFVYNELPIQNKPVRRLFTVSKPLRG